MTISFSVLFYHLLVASFILFYSTLFHSIPFRGLFYTHALLPHQCFTHEKHSLQHVTWFDPSHLFKRTSPSYNDTSIILMKSKRRDTLSFHFRYQQWWIPIMNDTWTVIDIFLINHILIKTCNQISWTDHHHNDFSAERGSRLRGLRGGAQRHQDRWGSDGGREW